jgi:hypothetical protein
MAQIDDSPPRPKPLSIYARPIAMAVVWVSLASIGVIFVSLGGEMSLNDGIAFGCSLEISAASAAMAASWIGGKRRWAVEIAGAVVAVSVILAVLLGYLLWLDTTFARRKLNMWQLRGVQEIAWHWPGQIAVYNGPLGIVVGLMLGSITGLVTILARRRFGWAMAIALAILFAFASDAARQFASDAVTSLGLLFRFAFRPDSYSDDQISSTGMILGAIAGSIMSGIAMHVTRKK